MFLFGTTQFYSCYLPGCYAHKVRNKKTVLKQTFPFVNVLHRAKVRISRSPGTTEEQKFLFIESSTYYRFAQALRLTAVCVPQLRRVLTTPLSLTVGKKSFGGGVVPGGGGHVIPIYSTHPHYGADYKESRMVPQESDPPTNPRRNNATRQQRPHTILWYTLLCVKYK